MMSSGPCLWKEVHMRIPSVGSKKRTNMMHHRIDDVRSRAISACCAEALEERRLLSVVVRTVVADTYVQASAPDTNFGASSNTCAAPLAAGSGCLVVLNNGADSTTGLSRIT